MRKKLFKISGLVFLSLIMSGIASQAVAGTSDDPYETFNRAAFAFNEKMDEKVARPAARIYRFMVFPQVRTGVTNVFQNIGQIPTIADDILQGDFIHAMGDSWRFFINSTFGLLGVFDLAGNMNEPISYHYNDFGLVMARWGVKKSEYLVIPILGPSTARDTLGIFVDYYGFSPISRIHPYWQRYALLGLYGVNTRTNYLDYQNLLEAAALDKYVFQRNAYLQRRQYLIEQMDASIEEEYADLHKENHGFFLRPGKV